MANKEDLTTMIDSFIDKNDTEAEIAFHNYLSDKMKEELNQPYDDIDVT